MKFAGLMVEAHATALEKGWHEGKERTIDRALSLVALLHSEVDEVWEELARKRPSLLFDVVEGKPVGLLPELADVLIRLADAYAFFGWPFSETEIIEPAHIFFKFSGTVAQEVCRLNAAIVRNITEPIRRTGRPTEQAVQVIVGIVFDIAESTALNYAQKQVGLLAAVEAKLAYNRTRTHRHGGKLA